MSRANFNGIEFRYDTFTHIYGDNVIDMDFTIIDGDYDEDSDALLRSLRLTRDTTLIYQTGKMLRLVGVAYVDVKSMQVIKDNPYARIEDSLMMRQTLAIKVRTKFYTAEKHMMRWDADKFRSYSLVEAWKILEVQEALSCADG